MKTHDQTLHSIFNNVKEFNIVKSINFLINNILYSRAFNQFITIILK